MPGMATKWPSAMDGSAARLYSRQEALRIAPVSDHQAHELINCAASNCLMRAALFGRSNLGVARVMGVFDPAVRVPRAKPLLGRPAVEGIATLPRQDRSDKDFHGGSLQR